MESLLSSFRRERHKQEIKTGSGTEDIHKSTWFAFNLMLFLLDKFVPKQTKNTEVNNIFLLVLYKYIL
nr:unnamed protein product [Callosobruchus chinensis]